MTPPERIVVFYSADADYAARLRAARRAFPDARITAVIPATQTLSDGERACVDHVHAAEPAAYSPVRVRRFLGFLRALRAMRADLFIVMFDSLRLGLLGAAARPRRLVCWDGEMRIIPIPRCVLLVATRAAVRVVVGHLRWLVRAARIYGPDLWHQPPLDHSRPEGKVSPRERRFLNRLDRLRRPPTPDA